MPQPQPKTWRCPDWPSRLVATGVLCGLMVWMFRDLLMNCVDRWMNEPQYSHGFVIPLIAIRLGFKRRNRIRPAVARSSSIGLVLTAIGGILHQASTWFFVEAFDGLGFLSCLCGIALVVWGNRFFLGLWPAILFVGFMLPLPFQIERMLSGPLQMLGASESAWFIQTLGIPAIAQGNTILMGDIRLGVAEACSGMRMLMVFIAISAATVIMKDDRARWEKLLILLSAVPIALISNIVRIVATAVAFQYASRETADLIFHDWSGWFMMPFAILLLFLEFKLLDWLFVEVSDAKPGLSWHAAKA